MRIARKQQQCRTQSSTTTATTVSLWKETQQETIWVCGRKPEKSQPVIPVQA